MREWILTKEKYLDDWEAERLRKATENAAMAAHAKGLKTAVIQWMVIDLAMSTGLRVSEMANLRIGDIYIGRGQSELIVRRGKGGKSGRVVISAKLKRHIKEFIDWKKESGLPVDDGDYLITSQRGNKFTTRGLQLLFKKCLERAGLNPGYGFHCLRHTYAVQLYKASGWNLRLVQKHLRHSSIKTTQVYADVRDADAEKAVNGLWE
jgi:site-specific recombinase XerD